MFLINVNDIQRNMSNESCINLFADDAKILRTVINAECCKELQGDLDKLHKGSEK